MTEEANAPAPSAATAGSLLREARQAQGLHIAALAAAIKVSPRKLEALEGDRYDELPDTTFTRALAQAVCRALKIAPEPVLSRLPQAPGQGLDQVSGGLNAPFRERGVRRDTRERLVVSPAVLWGSAALVLAAIVVWLVPQGWLQSHLGGGSVPAASAPAAAASVPLVVASMAAPQSPPASAVANPVQASAPPSASPSVGEPASAARQSNAQPSGAASVAPAPASGAASAMAAPSGSGLHIQANGGPSWVEVRDAGNKVLIARTLAQGEEVSFDAAPPLRVKIGDARVTRVRFQGRDVPLPPRETIARLELK